MTADLTTARSETPPSDFHDRSAHVGPRRRGSAASTAMVVMVALSMVWIGAVTIVASGGHLPSIALPSGPASVANTKPAYLYFTVTTSASTDYDTFYPANVTVPANQPIIVTITDYDPGVNNVSTPYNQVIGTAGGSATYNDGLGDAPRTVSS
ncbi:MAG: hypothetical protein L3J73_04545, partial [Thermoplasmata archaeon]|nr:hypothetical protein [Thermoplasmata archaeon]